MKAVPFLLTFVVLVLTASAQNCSNPLITRAGWWGQLSVVADPIDYTPEMSICAAAGIEDGGKSCCSRQFAAQLTNAWSAARNVITATKDSLKDAGSTMRQSFQQAKNAIDDAQMPQEQKDQAKKMLETVLNVIADFFDNFPSAYAKCANYMLKYNAGVACFWCNPNWGKYVTNENNQLYFHLAQSNCETFGDNCADLLILINTLMDKMLQGIADIPNQGDFGTGTNLYSACKDKASCKQFICGVGNFLSGTDAFNPGLSQFTPPTGKRFELPASVKIANHAALGEFETQVNEALHPVNKIASSFARQTTSNVVNTYDNSGYDALEVGTATALSTEVDGSSASTISSWMF